jgi:peptide chain release factor 3
MRGLTSGVGSAWRLQFRLSSHPRSDHGFRLKSPDSLITAILALPPMTTFLDELNRRRTFAIISHPDAGKTTLTEKLLLYAARSTWPAPSSRERPPPRRVRLDGDGAARRASPSRRRCCSSTRSGAGSTCSTRRATRTSRRTPTGCWRRWTRGDADRRGQGRRGAHAQAVRGVPDAEAPGHHLRQQDGSPRPRPDRPHGRRRQDAEDPHRAAQLADRRCASEFTGVFDRLSRDVVLWRRDGQGGTEVAPEEKTTLDDPGLRARVGDRAYSGLTEGLELVEAAGDAWSHEEYLAGELTPFFFGSAMTNFGISQVLQALATLAPAPSTRRRSRVGGPRSIRSSAASCSRSRRT